MPGQVAAAVAAALLLGASAARAANAAIPAPEDLPEFAIAAVAEARSDPRVLFVELRGDAAVAAATVEGAMRPDEIQPNEISAQCITVFIADAETGAETLAAAAKRFRAAGCELRRLAGDAEAWRVGGLARPKGQRRPGEVPFVVPRGLCEGEQPAQVFE
jgi:hypothetical protein